MDFFKAINESLFSNKSIQEAKRFSLVQCFVLVLLSVLLLGFANGYQLNKKINRSYQAYQEVITSGLAATFIQMNGCSIDSTKYLQCDNEVKAVENFEVLNNLDSDIEGKNVIGLLKDRFVIAYQDLVLQGPYSFEYTFDVSLSLAEQKAVADLFVYSLIQSGTAFNMQNELLYSFVLLIINLILVTSVLSYMEIKKIKRKIKRSDFFKMISLMSLLPSVVSALVVVILPIDNMVSMTVFTILFYVRIFFYVKVFMK